MPVISRNKGQDDQHGKAEIVDFAKTQPKLSEILKNTGLL